MFPIDTDFDTPDLRIAPGSRLLLENEVEVGLIQYFHKYITLNLQISNSDHLQYRGIGQVQRETSWRHRDQCGWHEENPQSCDGNEAAEGKY